MARQAWADESFHEDDHTGFYVIAAAVIEAGLYESARMMLDRLRGGLATKFHWTEMDARHRRDAAQRLAAIDGMHIVVIGAPVPRRRQERARAKCLETLAFELQGYGVDTLYMEAREAELNARDIRTVAAARYRLPRHSRFRVEHLNGAAEPLLWAADIVAGACSAARRGDRSYRDILAARIYDVEIGTDC